MNRWVHVVGRWDSNRQCDAWKDGKQGAKRTDCWNGQRNNNAEHLAIGGRHTNDRGHNIKVMVSDVSVFNRALSDDEVKMLWNNGIRPSLSSSASGEGPKRSISFTAEVQSPSVFADSVWAYVDGDSAARQLWNVGINKEIKESLPSPQFQVKPGSHTLTIQGREDGMKLRNIFMKDGSGCVWKDSA